MRTFERQLLAGFGMLLAVVAVTSVLSLVSVRRSGDAHDDAQAAGELEILLTNASFSLRDLAAIHRGFLLSGDQLFLDRFEDAAADVRARVSAVTAAAGSDASIRGDLDRLAERLEDHLELLATAIALEQEGNEQAAEALVLQGSGLQRSDELRATLIDLRDEVARQRAALIDDADALARQAFLLVVAVGAISLVLVLAGIALYRRERARLRQAEAAQREAAAQVENLNRKVSQRNAELEAANAELESFSYSVSHDLRAPLRTIDGFSAVLLEDYGDALDADARATIDRIRAGSNRMGMLIDDLLNLSRVTRADLRRMPVDLSATAASVVADLRRQEPEREVDIVVAPGLAAEADPHLLRVLLENLIGNAWKFTRDNPHACIEICPTEIDGETVYVVRDNGAGFDMAYVHKLFTPFQRLHRADEFEGTGIGLATVARIARRHGGRTWAEAALGDGASFYFTLGGDGT